MSKGNDDDGPIWDARAIFTNNAVHAFIWVLAEWFAEHADDGATVETLQSTQPSLAHLRRRLFAVADRLDHRNEGPLLDAEDRRRLKLMSKALDHEIAMFLQERDS